MGRHTVQRYARAASWEELADGKWQEGRTSMLDPFKAHLRQGFQQGCTNAAELYRQLTALGFAGSYGLVRDFLEQVPLLASSDRPGAADGACGDRLADPPSRPADRRRAPAAAGDPGAVPAASGSR